MQAAALSLGPTKQPLPTHRAARYRGGTAYGEIGDNVDVVSELAPVRGGSPTACSPVASPCPGQKHLPSLHTNQLHTLADAFPSASLTACLCTSTYIIHKQQRAEEIAAGAPPRRVLTEPGAPVHAKRGLATPLELALSTSGDQYRRRALERVPPVAAAATQLPARLVTAEMRRAEAARERALGLEAPAAPEPAGLEPAARRAPMAAMPAAEAPRPAPAPAPALEPRRRVEAEEERRGVVIAPTKAPPVMAAAAPREAAVAEPETPEMLRQRETVAREAAAARATHAAPPGAAAPVSGAAAMPAAPGADELARGREERGRTFAEEERGRGPMMGGAAVERSPLMGTREAEREAERARMPPVALGREAAEERARMPAATTEREAERMPAAVGGFERERMPEAAPPARMVEGGGVVTAIKQAMAPTAAAEPGRAAAVGAPAGEGILGGGGGGGARGFGGGGGDLAASDDAEARFVGKPAPTTAGAAGGAETAKPSEAVMGAAREAGEELRRVPMPGQHPPVPADAVAGA